MPHSSTTTTTTETEASSSPPPETQQGVEDDDDENSSTTMNRAIIITPNSRPAVLVVREQQDPSLDRRQPSYYSATSPPPLDFTEPLLDAQRRQLDTLIQVWSSSSSSRSSSSISSSNRSMKTGALLSTLEEEQQQQQQQQQQEPTHQTGDVTASSSLSSTASAVLIRGVPGSGKTYLLNAFASHVQRTLNEQTSTENKNNEEDDDHHVLTARSIFGPSPAADREPFATIVDLVESLLESLVQWCNRSSSPCPGKSLHQRQRLRRVTWRDRLQKALTAQELLLLQATLPYLQVLLDPSDDDAEKEDDVHAGADGEGSTTTTRRQARQKQRRRCSFRRRSRWSVASSILGGEDGGLLDSSGGGGGGGGGTGVDDDNEQQDAFVGPTRQGQRHRSLEKEWRLERFQLAIRALIRCLARHQPILLMLDNIQWASTDSLQIIRTLIHDPILHQQQHQHQHGRHHHHHKWNHHNPHARLLNHRPSKGKWKRFLLVGAYRNDDNDDAIFWCLQAPPNCGHSNDDDDDDPATRTSPTTTSSRVTKKKNTPDLEAKKNSGNSTATAATVPSTNSSVTVGCCPVVGPGSAGLQELSSTHGSSSATFKGGIAGCANVMLMPLSDRLTRQELSHWICRQLVSSLPPSSTPSKQAAITITSSTTLQEKQQDDLSPSHLVEMVYTKTGGHPFSVVQVLQKLQSRGCFRYSQSKNRWEWWKDSKITAALKSVPSCSLKKPFVKISRQLIIDKIRTMDKSQQMVLLTAALLGSSTFDAETLVHAMTACDDEEDDDDETNDSNDTLVGDLSIQTLLRQHQNRQLSASTTATKPQDPDQPRLPLCGSTSTASCSTADGTNLVMNILSQLVKEGKGWLMEEDVFAESESGGGGKGSEYEHDDCRRFCFCHELVREAASTMPLHSSSSSSSSLSSSASSPSRDVDNTPKLKIHLRIGRRLNYCLQERHETGVQVEDPMLLNCVLQLNLASDLISDRWEIIDLVELNYQAAEVHAIKSSFFVARCFLLKGISLLGEAPWVDHYDLMKKISNALTRMQYCCGELDDSLQTADKVIANTGNLSEQRIAYHTKIVCLHQQKQTKAAVELTVFLLAELGYSFPKRGLRVHVAQSILRTRRLLRGWSDDELLNLPRAAPQDNDSLGNACELMLFLAQLSSPSSSFFHGTIGANGFCETSSYSTLALLRLLQTTLTHGRIPITPICYVAWSWLLAQTGDYDGAQRFGRLGMRLATEGNCYDAHAKILYHGFVAHWRLLFQDCLLSVSNSITELWNYGALDLIHANSICEVRLAFLCGQPLNELAQATQNLASLLTDYNQRAQYNVHLPVFQMVSNLVGQCECPTKLTGQYMDEQDKIVVWENSGNESALQTLYFCSATLAFIFNDLSLADEMCGNLWPSYMDSSDCWIPYRFFLRGMVHFSMARSTGSRKHRRNGDAVIRQFEKWAKEGVLSIGPMLLMLRAEHVCTSSSKKSAGVVRKVWDDAVDASARLGFIHLQALSNELAGTYFRDVPTLEGNNNHFLAVRYLTQATCLYRQWGCAGKVTQMQTRYNDILEPCSEALSIHSGSSQSSFLRANMERQLSGGTSSTGRSGRHLRWSAKI